MKHTERIGIFGGAFNPPHMGHERLVRSAADRLLLSRLYIIPTAFSPHKSTAEFASGDDRLALCRLTFSDMRCEISDLELRRGGVSYTVDTLRTLRRKHPEAEIFLLVGGDMLASFHSWKDYGEILQMATLCVMRRTQEALPENPHFTQEQREKVLFLDAPPLVISSTEIRLRCAQGEDITHFVCSAVAQYIRERGLYGATKY